MVYQLRLNEGREPLGPDHLHPIRKMRKIINKNMRTISLLVYVLTRNYFPRQLRVNYSAKLLTPFRFSVGEYLRNK